MTKQEAETAAITLIMLGECDGMERDLIEIIRSGELWSPGENMLLKCAVCSLQYVPDDDAYKRVERSNANSYGVEPGKVWALRKILKKLHKEAGKK